MNEPKDTMDHWKEQMLACEAQANHRQNEREQKAYQAVGHTTLQRVSVTNHDGSSQQGDRLQQHLRSTDIQTYTIRHG